MTQTLLKEYELDPTLHRNHEPQPLTSDEIAWQQEMNAHTVATLYGDMNPRGIESSLDASSRMELYDFSNGAPREAAMAEVMSVKEGDAAYTHDLNVREIQSDASAEVGRLTGDTEVNNPGERTVEARVIGEDIENTLEGKVVEGIGLGSEDQREITRAATAGELIRRVIEEQDVSALEHMPPQSGVKAGSDIARMVEKYGNADRIPTEELALLGQYLENVDATTATGNGETYVAYDHETGEPREQSLDDLVVDVMNGGFATIEAGGYHVSDDKKAAITRVNEAFGVPGLDATGRAERARRIREHILEIMRADAPA